MNKFSYSLELYKRNIFSLNELKKYNKYIESADKIEEYFYLKNNNLDIIRNNIILSYSFMPTLKYDDRINNSF